jgi:leucyl aminopeptidase
MPALSFAPPDSPAIRLVAVTKVRCDAWLASQDSRVRTWAEATGFDGGAGRVMVVPDASGRIDLAVAGLGTPRDAARDRFVLAKARTLLPAGTYRLETELTGRDLEEAALGWLLAGYRFGRYASATPPKAELVAPEGLDVARIEAIAAGEALTRDLINTPASDMGPEELAEAAAALAREFGAAISTTVGEDLLAANLPMIHAVGRASPRAPRLIDMRWGDAGPRLTLVGKGVCFDTGGLNLKPSGSMGLMKKDMGGAATVLGLARMIMALNLPLRLRVLIPAVENAVSGASFRPQDVLTSRKGLTVEINNTDAEGRLVLADALALASEDGADLLVSMATLTGAARVALGPDLVPFFTDDDRLADALAQSAAAVRDPLWRLPFWEPYETLIEPGIADLDNAPSGGMAGAITAALFLRRFADVKPYVHFDIYGWQPSAAAGRPKGGVGQGARALLEALPRVLDL